MATFAGWGASWGGAWERVPSIESSSATTDAWGSSWGLSWARSWGRGIGQGGQVYGGKRRQARVDDLTAEQVRKHWEYLEEKATREAPPVPASKAPALATATAPATAPATAEPAAPLAPLPAGIKLANPKAQLVRTEDLAAMTQAMALQRAELDAAIVVARRAAEDALIFSLLGD